MMRPGVVPLAGKAGMGTSILWGSAPGWARRAR